MSPRIFPAILLLLLILGCGRSGSDERPLVVATIHPYELLLRELLGPEFEVRTLIPANASPHSYSPAPQDIAVLHEAELVFSNGLGLEHEFERAFSALGERHVRAEDLLGKALAGPETNPHVWLSPVLMQELTQKLGERLQKAFPEQAESIAHNSRNLGDQLAALDEKIQRERASLGPTPLITFHDSFHHLNSDYRIDNLGSVQSSPGREPTPRELADLGELIRTNGVRAICVEPQMDRRSAEVLAREFGLQVVELDPLGFSLEAETLPDLIEINWERMLQTWSQGASG